MSAGTPLGRSGGPFRSWIEEVFARAGERVSRWLVDAVRAATESLRRQRWGERLYRVLVAGVRHWRRSLQLRVVTITLVCSALVVAGFGLVVAQRVTDGLVDAKRDAALGQMESGRRHAQQQLSVLAAHDDPNLKPTLLSLISTLSNVPGRAGEFDVVLDSSDPGISVDPVTTNNAAERYVPKGLHRMVASSGLYGFQFTRANPDGGGMRPYLVVGTPVKLDWGTFELFYLFPLDEETEADSRVRETVLIAG
ncbi:MAG: hypothetical protein ACRDT8_21960, partial [Micromonosporaceae bacterium]